MWGEEPTEVVGPINPLIVVSTQDGLDEALKNSYGLKALLMILDRRLFQGLKQVRLGSKSEVSIC